MVSWKHLTLVSRCTSNSVIWVTVECPIVENGRDTVPCLVALVCAHMLVPLVLEVSSHMTIMNVVAESSQSMGKL